MNLINVKIKQHLDTMEDPNEKLQFLQSVFECCQKAAGMIQLKYNVPFAEMLSPEQIAAEVSASDVVYAEPQPTEETKEAEECNS